MDEPVDPALAARRVRRQKTVLGVAVAVFLGGTIAGLSSLVVLELRRERSHNEELARAESAGRSVAGATYRCARAETPPRIDGRIDPEEWRTAPWSSELVTAQEDAAGSAAPGARVRLAWDDRALYVATRVEPRERPDARRDLLLELLLGAAGEGPAVAVAVGADGALRPPPFAGGAPAAAAAWALEGVEHAVRVDGAPGATGTNGGWTVELALPWASLAERAGVASPPRPGDSWRIALRCCAGEPEVAAVTWRTLELVAGG
jgi:hypothetical protein